MAYSEKVLESIMHIKKLKQPGNNRRLVPILILKNGFIIKRLSRIDALRINRLKNSKYSVAYQPRYKGNDGI